MLDGVAHALVEAGAEKELEGGEEEDGEGEEEDQVAAGGEQGGATALINGSIEYTLQIQYKTRILNSPC